MKRKKILVISIFLFLIICTLFITINNSQVIEDENNFTIDVTEKEIAEYVEVDYQLDLSYNLDECIIIDLKEDSIYTTSTVKVQGSKAYISSGGTYILKGKLNNGQIIINSEDKEEVKIILDNVDINSNNGSPIVVDNAEKVILILADRTKNYISDSSEYVDPDLDEDATTSAIFSKDDLYIGGSGELVITSINKNGLQSKDQLIILDGKINIKSGKEAIKVKDYLIIESGYLDLTAGEDGISVTKEEDAEKGWIKINGGTIKINAEQDGISAKTYLIINGGDLNITTNSINEDKSSKAIKSDYYLCINGGEIKINSKDDGLHSNNKIVLNGGQIYISSGDDGIHSDELIEINDVYLNIEQSVEGIEGRNIYLNQGEIFIVSSDDGVNIADPNSNTNDMMALSGAALYINGGYLYVDANGDGLDSNGNIYIAGGIIIVHGPTNNGNGGLDYNGECIIDGGFLVVASSSGMAESPDQESKQNSVLIGFTNTLPAETLVHIESEDGEEIITFKPSKSFQAIVISLDKLKTGETYKIYTGGVATGEEKNGLYNLEDYKEGTFYNEFTITNSKTLVGTVGGMGGGLRGMGGMPPGRIINNIKN